MGPQRLRLATRNKPAPALHRLITLRSPLGRRNPHRLLRSPNRQRTKLHIHDDNIRMARQRSRLWLLRAVVTSRPDCGVLGAAVRDAVDSEPERLACGYGDVYRYLRGLWRDLGVLRGCFSESCEVYAAC